MKTVYNRLLPPKGFKAINLFGVVMVRKGYRMTDTDLNHEAIHTAQMRELLYVPFYVLYVLEWLWLLPRYPKRHEAYRHISFECEAYAHQAEPDYLKARPKFNQYKS